MRVLCPDNAGLMWPFSRFSTSMLHLVSKLNSEFKNWWIPETCSNMRSSPKIRFMKHQALQHSTEGPEAKNISLFSVAAVS